MVTGRLAVGGGWRLAVGGPWGLSLTKKLGVLKDSPDEYAPPLPRASPPPSLRHARVSIASLRLGTYGAVGVGGRRRCTVFRIFRFPPVLPGDDSRCEGPPEHT